MSTYKILRGDVLEKLKEIPDETVQTCITSPPYWGLRDYGVPGQIGLEKTPEEYVAKMVEVFREVRRVLRKDGTVWLNLGDSYNGSGGAGGDYSPGGLKEGQPKYPGRNIGGLKPKDLCGIPWSVAFALQADGWWLRSDIIWSKPNPMPESVTDRPTKAHEYIFLLTKSAKYYYDADAIREPLSEAMLREIRDGYNGKAKKKYDGTGAQNPSDVKSRILDNRSNSDGASPTGSNARTVWEITTKPYGGAHFATFPPEIPERCIKVGTSEKGCCVKCGAPMGRVTEIGKLVPDAPGYKPRGNKRGDALVKNAMTPAGEKQGHPNHHYEKSTIGWRSTCKCNAGTKPCVVLDPFCGSGTTGEVALRMGRDFIGIELNEKYVKELIEPRLANVSPLFINTEGQ